MVAGASGRAGKAFGSLGLEGAEALETVVTLEFGVAFEAGAGLLGRAVLALGVAETAGRAVIAEGVLEAAWLEEPAAGLEGVVILESKPTPVHGTSNTCPTRKLSASSLLRSRNTPTLTPYKRATPYKVSPAATVCLRSGTSMTCPTRKLEVVRLLARCNASGVVPKRRARLYSVSPGCTVYGAANAQESNAHSVSTPPSTRCLMTCIVAHARREMFAKGARRMFLRA
jgi:hypothetical protein